MSQRVHFVKDVLNGVEIDRPATHELSTYATGIGYNGEPISKHDHAGAAIQSIKYKGLDRYGNQPVFTVRFKIEFDSIQEIAANFWRFDSLLKIVEVLDDGIIVEVEEAQAACSIDTTVNPVMNDRYASHPGIEAYPIDCALLKAAVLEAGSYDAITDEAHEEMDDTEHWCTGNIYEVAIAVVPEGASKATNVGELTEDLFSEDEFDGSLFMKTDEEVREVLWDEPELLTFVTGPNGNRYRVISNMHED